jgi:nucleoside-diphosphate-sugar epimerase
MLNIAVIGCGWLGLPLAVSLVKNNYTVFGTTTSINKIPYLKELGISSFILDLSKPIQINQVEFLNKIDLVIINIPPSKLKGDKSYSDSLLELVKLIQTSTKIILISTTGVYPDEVQLADESYKFKSEDLEKETVQAEVKLIDYLTNRLTIIRLAGLLGEDRHPVKFLAGRKDIPNGNAPINLIHQNDAIGIINKVIDENYWGEIINGCYPSHPVKSQYYTDKAILLDLEPPLFLNQGEECKKVSEIKSIKELKYSYSSPI